MDSSSLIISIRINPTNCQATGIDDTKNTMAMYFWFRQLSGAQEMLSPFVCLCSPNLSEALNLLLLASDSSCWHQDDFRITSGWIQDDYSTGPNVFSISMSRMFQNVCKMFQNVSECMQNVPEWVRIFQNVLKCFRMFQKVRRMF